MSQNKIVERLPEINAIRGNLREYTIEAFEKGCPEYFWIVRGARRHHYPDERGLGGLWLHTKRAFVCWTHLEQTFRAMGGISDFEANCARSAILMHDMFKCGRYDVDEALPNEEDEHPYADGLLAGQPGFNDEHDIECAKFIREETQLPEEVARCVETHGGSTQWGATHKGPSPNDDLTLAHHLADYVASRAVPWPVYDPSDELLTMIDSDVPTIEEEDWITRVLNQ